VCIVGYMARNCAYADCAHRCRRDRCRKSLVFSDSSIGNVPFRKDENMGTHERLDTFLVSPQHMDPSRCGLNGDI
jgi:hypothetical protein